MEEKNIEIWQNEDFRRGYEQAQQDLGQFLQPVLEKALRLIQGLGQHFKRPDILEIAPSAETVAELKTLANYAERGIREALKHIERNLEEAQRLVL